MTLSHAGYAKSQPAEVYQAQRRGGRGRTAARVKDEDFIDQLFVANSHDTVLCFSSRGKAYWLKVYQVPQAAPGARGRPIVNLLPLEEGERINAVLPVKAFEEDKFVFLATKHGTVKKTPLAAFARPAHERHHRRRAARRRPADRRRHHERQSGHHAVRELRQGDPVRGAGRAPDGPNGRRRARPQARRADRRGHRAQHHRRAARSSPPPRTATASSRRSRSIPCKAAAARASSASRRRSATAGSSARCRSRRTTSSC